MRMGPVPIAFCDNVDKAMDFAEKYIFLYKKYLYKFKY